ncbi:hypothetical protein BY458DRAFT_432697 [Sporodiniella umbellata]|nr:hypothetical protein BY458DRAFT_432697 [Sporodiniella umbellata]
MLRTILILLFGSFSSAIPSRTRVLPVESPAYLPKFPFYSTRAMKPVPTGPILRKPLNTQHYPSLWMIPDTTHPEVKKAIKSIQWDFVPPLAPRPTQGNITYNDSKDPDCWWSRTECTIPKVKYLPPDIFQCEDRQDFGLTYDDGPLNPNGDNDTWGEPHLYDFLARFEQESTLFYVGSNVVSFPQAAKRALQSGHTICAHTWSHPQMTSITNHQIVAELYWTLRAIKEATGVTTRCWRPPFGDTDDRVRAIAHQMGLRTILWNSDSFDWKLPSYANDYAGVFSESAVDTFFEDWINHKLPHGRIVLEHETSDVTIKTTERWLPRLKKAYSVKKVHDCVSNLESPYWEK